MGSPDHVTLPGQPSNMGFQQFSGLIPVGENNQSSLFYWLVESSTSPKLKPLVLWLSGGPGCSSIGLGGFQQIGPFRVEQNGENLSLSNTSWNSEANILFLDAPVGVGFSFTKLSYQYGDNNNAKDSFMFLVNWLERFPEYKQRDLYIVGEGYGGHFAPQLAQLILHENKRSCQKSINFKGLMLGNADMDTKISTRGEFDYWWSHGLVSEAKYIRLKKDCTSVSLVNRYNPVCAAALNKANEEQGRIDLFRNIYGPICQVGALMTPGCSQYTITGYLNRTDVRKAMHTDVGGNSAPWERCSWKIRSQWSDTANSVLPILKEIMCDGHRIWLVRVFFNCKR